MRLHDGQDLSYWSGMASSKKMQKQLACRQEAEQKHRDFILKEKINTAYNTKMAAPVRYEPGDLVFYKRFQPPSDAKERSNRELDVPRRRVARWYGPARVLALETKVTYDGHVRQPHSIAWVIASGRLKKVHCNELRHSSPRERLVAEGTTQLTLPWTFQDMTHLISKGEYDDEIMLDKHMRADAKRFRHEHEELHRQHRSKNKRALEEEAGTTPSSPSTGQDLATSSTSRPRTSMETPTSSTTRPSTSFLPPETETMETIEENATEPADPLQHREQVQEDLDIDRLLDDPEHLPFGEPDPAPLFRHPLFLQARRRHEYEERPLHVRQREQAEQRGTNDQRGTGDEAASYFVGINDTAAFLDEVAECVFAVTLPTPASEAEWRSIVKDPSKFVAKKLAKGVEVA